MTTAIEWAERLEAVPTPSPEYRHSVPVNLGIHLTGEECRQLATLLRALVAEREAWEEWDRSPISVGPDAYEYAVSARRRAEGET